MTQDTILLISTAILLLPLLGFAMLIFFGKRLGRASGFIGTTILGLDLLLSILVLFTKLTTFADIQLIQTKFNWIDLGNNLFVKVGIGIDNLAAIM
nr:NADH-quinone oxidoreductase subunit L [Candidatus Kapabacteria bacterium]